MIKFGSFPFSDESKSIINEAVNNLWEKSRIEVSGSPGMDSAGVEILNIHVAQKEVVDGKTFTKAELHDLAYDIFFADKSISPVGQNIDIVVDAYDHEQQAS